VRHVDRWDALGGSGALLFGVGIWAIGGWPWALVVWGGLGLALYVVHEVR
jgi:hypothetical protein